MKRIFSFAFALLPVLATLSCTKGGGNEPGGETSKAQLGVVVKDAKTIYEVNQNESTDLELNVVANPTSADALTVTVAAKPALVSTYNTQKGTSYQMLPSDAFTLTTAQMVLPKYSAKSSNVQLRLKGAASCDPEATYVLPIAISSVQGGTNFETPDDKAAYIVFKVIPTESEGDGSQANPFVIKEVEDLMTVNAKLQDDATTYFKLGADLDFKDVTFTEDKPWTPINNYSDTDDSQSAARKRMISFDGDNHSISNLKADGPLFGILCGSVQNLTLSGFEIVKEGDDVAVLVGIAGAADNPDSFIAKNITITGSKVDNSTDIVQGKRAGGLVAYMRNGLVENCSADCSVETPQQGGALIGRLNAGTVKNCSASGDVLAESYHGGGLIGFVREGTVTGCHASGNVKQTTGGNSRVGGLIGSICGSATVEKSYATGNVEGIGHWAGGLIACIYDTATSTTVNVSECYATGTVTMPHENGNYAHVGALIGTVTPKSEATEFTVVNISNCYATGAVFTCRYSSGFLGSIYGPYADVKILNSYTTSDVSGILKNDRCGLVFGHGGSNLADGKSKITCKGFVGWNTGDPAWRFSWGWEKDGSYFDAFPEDGNYNGHEGTVSQQAQALGGWSTDIWDFSGSEPKLKNVK